MSVALGFASGDRPFFQIPLNPSSQIVSPVTLLISHYLYNNEIRQVDRENICIFV